MGKEVAISITTVALLMGSLLACGGSERKADNGPQSASNYLDSKSTTTNVEPESTTTDAEPETKDIETPDLAIKYGLRPELAAVSNLWNAFAQY